MTTPPRPPIIERLDLLHSELREAIVAPLAEFSTKKDFAFAPRFVTLALKDERGVDGGLIAQFYWDWMHVEILAVPERWRGLGLGRALMEQAEAIARKEGCTGVWVDTYSFQSPGFYAALGYEPVRTPAELSERRGADLPCQAVRRERTERTGEGCMSDETAPRAKITDGMSDAELDARHAEKMKKKKAARDKIIATKTIEKGLVIVHTGKGKGKSTAGFGLVFRALGNGMKSPSCSS